MKRTELGKELAKLRIEHDHTLKQMAQALKTTNSSLMSYEAGRRQPPATFFDNIKEAYKVELSRFFVSAVRKRKIGDHIKLSTFPEHIQKFVRAVLEGEITVSEDFTLEERKVSVLPATVAPQPARLDVPDVDGVDFIEDDSELEELDADLLESA